MLVLLSTAFVLCHGQEGSGGDVVVISPTSKGTPPADSTNDSGSGVDDEDGDGEDDEGSGSTTATYTTVTYTTVGPTAEEDEGSGGSGSGGGSTSPAFETKSTIQTTESTTATTENTDIYIETSSKKTNAADETSTTTKSVRTEAEEFPAEKTTASNVVDKTIETPASAIKSSGTMKARTTVQTPTEKPSTRLETTTAEPESTSELTKATKTVETKTKSTPSSEESTTSGQNMMALKGNKGEGFTLTTEVIAGVVGCALLALLLIAFLMYRLKKRDEGSYLLDDSCGNLDTYKKVDNSDKEAFV